MFVLVRMLYCVPAFLFFCVCVFFSFFKTSFCKEVRLMVLETLSLGQSTLQTCCSGGKTCSKLSKCWRNCSSTIILSSNFDGVMPCVHWCCFALVAGANDGERAGEGGVPEGGGEAEGPATQQGEAGRLSRASASWGSLAFLGCCIWTVKLKGTGLAQPNILKVFLHNPSGH